VKQQPPEHSGTAARPPRSIPAEEASLTLLDDLLHECCHELMADYGLADDADSTPVDAQGGGFVAAIDFSGKDLRGTVVFRASPNVIQQTFRAAGGPSDPLELSEAADWLCELVNQLVGRIKNKLRPYRVSFTVNVPRLLAGLPADKLEQSVRSRFVSGRGVFAGYLEVLISPGFAFEEPTPDASLPEEGELVLF
jgi:chemotaxis phosphatase CheX-like protein